MKPGLLDFQLFPLSDWRQLNERLSGNNGRHVLLVTELQQDDKELMDFLGKILSAVKLNIVEDTLLLKVTRSENISFSDLSRHHTARHILLFGIEPRQLGLHFSLPLNVPMSFGGSAFLYTFPLHSLFEERTADARPKAATLWKNLKRLFIDAETP